MKKKVSTFQKLSIMLIVILLFFGSLNFAWYVLKYRPYQQFVSKMTLGDDPELPRYYASDEKYTYIVKMPGYLSYGSGFMHVEPLGADEIYVDENGELLSDSDTSVGMFIWPGVFGETRYGATIWEGEESWQLYINEKLEYIPYEHELPTEIEANQKLISKYQTEIEEVMAAAQAMWGLEE